MWGVRKISQLKYTRLAQNLALVASEYGLIHPYHELPYRVVRTYAGYYQRLAGAWSFYLADLEGHEVFGSCYRAKEVWKAYKEKRLQYYLDYGSPTFIVERVYPIVNRRKIENVT